MSTIRITDASWPGINDSGRTSLQKTYGDKKIAELGTNMRVIFTVSSDNSVLLSSDTTIRFDYYPEEGAGMGNVQIEHTERPIYALTSYIETELHNFKEKQETAL